VDPLRIGVRAHCFSHDGANSEAREMYTFLESYLFSKYEPAAHGDAPNCSKPQQAALHLSRIL